MLRDGYHLLLLETGKDPSRLDDGQRELERALVLDAGSAAGRSGRGRAHKVGRVDLDLVRVASTHLIERPLGLVEQVGVLDVAETDRDARRVAVGWEGLLCVSSTPCPKQTAEQARLTSLCVCGRGSRWKGRYRPKFS